jgi:hypothetical protein
MIPLKQLLVSFALCSMISTTIYSQDEIESDYLDFLQSMVDAHSQYIFYEIGPFSDASKIFFDKKSRIKLRAIDNGNFIFVAKVNLNDYATKATLHITIPINKIDTTESELRTSYTEYTDLYFSTIRSKKDINVSFKDPDSIEVKGTIRSFELPIRGLSSKEKKDFQRCLWYFLRKYGASSHQLVR